MRASARETYELCADCGIESCRWVDDGGIIRCTWCHCMRGYFTDETPSKDKHANLDPQILDAMHKHTVAMTAREIAAIHGARLGAVKSALVRLQGRGKVARSTVPCAGPRKNTSAWLIRRDTQSEVKR